MIPSTEHRPQVRPGDLDGLAATSLEEMSTVADLHQFLRNRGDSASRVLWAPETGRVNPGTTYFTPMGDWVIQPGRRGGYRLSIQDRDQMVGDPFSCATEREVVQTILRNDELEPPPDQVEALAAGERALVENREKREQMKRDDREQRRLYAEQQRALPWWRQERRYRKSRKWWPE